jgi:simple sugar transport system ATP-binding protein
MVVPPLTVAENVFLNRRVEGEGAVIDWKRMRAEARELMLEWGFDLDVDQQAATLTVEQRQIVEIARALSIGARFLILDEPTAALEKAAVDRLFERVRRLTEGGVGVLYISHHLEEIYEICQRVSVLRDGELVLTGRVGDINLAAMVGSAPPRRATEIEAVGKVGALGDKKLEIRQLTVASRAGPVYDVDLSVRAGECVGLVGLRGSGTSTVADSVVGLVKPRSGSVAIDGSAVPLGRVHETWRRGVGYVPQDRHARGFSPQLGVDENLTHAILDRIAGRFGIVSARKRSRIAEKEEQKVVVGRALAANPTVLVAVNPTVGVDVASKEALLDALAHARDGGVAVLLVSDDFDDLRICTRLVVMVRGRITREFDRAPWDRQQLISAVEGLEVAI